MRLFILLWILLFACLADAQNLMSQYLDKNRVKALVCRANDRFWQTYSSGNAAYEVPKGSGSHAQYANGLWIAGLDSSNKLHMCINTFQTSFSDYYSGPVDTVNITAVTPSLTGKYSRVWKVDCDDITGFVSAYNSGAVAAGTYTIPDAIKNYPAVQQGNFMNPLESYNDVFNNGSYDPQQEGDYPLIKGHQQILSIYNDSQQPHSESGMPALGIEVHEKSYSFYEPNIHDSMKIINFTTFYEFTVYNRSNDNYHDVYVTDWTDVDLGNGADDYIGTDTADQFVFCYNGNNPDIPTQDNAGYGSMQPVITHALLDCASCPFDGIDNNHNSVVDEPNENFLVDYTMYFNDGPGNQGTPQNANDYYKYMQARWRDSTHLKYGGTGYSPFFGPSSNWFYTGDPQSNNGWTEPSAMNFPGDRRILMSSGPFDLPAKRSFVYSYAVIFSRDTLSAVNTISQFDTRVKTDVRNARYYARTHQAPQCAPAVSQPVITSLNGSVSGREARIYPNPTGGMLSIGLNRSAGAEVCITDLTGRLLLRKSFHEDQNVELDVTELKSGVYIVEMDDGIQRTTQKLIKQ